MRTDQHGVVIHGILAAYEGWQVAGRTANRLTAELDYGGTPRLLVSFPFPHLLTLDVTLADRVLTVKTTVTATTRADVPLCFGFHPYLRIPDVPRGEWQMETARHAVLPRQRLADSHRRDRGPRRVDRDVGRQVLRREL